MCDTFLAPPASTAARAALFGKNSDRQRNEAQAVEFHPGSEHAVGAAVTCTYLTIPQVRRTNAVLLSRPFWIWGAEMGSNEHGVVIGNEGLHARVPPPEQPALTGMDLLRLALERASTAAEAVEVIVALLEEYGQGGNCGHLAPAYYNNGFMIADANEAYVLETLEKHWLLERVSGIRTMSNRYSIQHADRVSDHLPELIRASGWQEGKVSDYSSALANPDREHLGNAGARRACSAALLSSRRGRLTVLDAMRVLRDHGNTDRYHPEWRAEATTVRTICMHAGAADRAGQTVGSWVSEIGRDAVHWVTATAAPCTSIFKPALLGVPVLVNEPALSGIHDDRTLWWRHERLHRAAIRSDLGGFLTAISAERDLLEADFDRRVKAVLSGGNATDKARVIADCWREALEVETRWLEYIQPRATRDDTPFAREWSRLDREARMEIVGD
jgi:dipeptidase